MIGTDFSITAVGSLATAAVELAEQEANKYLSKRYDISQSTFQTYTSCPPILRTIVRRLSVGYMYEGLARGGEDAFNRADRYIKSATENLMLISDRQLDLLNTSGSVVADLSTGSYRIQCNTSTYKDTFAEDDPLNWKVDSNKLDDIADDRDDS